GPARRPRPRARRRAERVRAAVRRLRARRAGGGGGGLQRVRGPAPALPHRRSSGRRRAGRRSRRRLAFARRCRPDPPCDIRRGSTMTTFEALVLGIVQGVTEFLPISSTAHLRIVPALAGWGDAGAAFTAVLQLGTLAAVVGYFLPDLLR